MRMPLHYNHVVSANLRRCFTVPGNPYAKIRLITYGGKKVVCEPRAHYACDNFYGLLIVRLENGKDEVFYAGDIVSAEPLNFDWTTGNNHVGGKEPLPYSNRVRISISDALTSGKRVRIHFNGGGDYRPEGRVVEHLRTEEGGWFCVGLADTQPQSPEFVARFYTPEIERVEFI